MDILKPINILDKDKGVYTRESWLRMIENMGFKKVTREDNITLLYLVYNCDDNHNYRMFVRDYKDRATINVYTPFQSFHKECDWNDVYEMEFYFGIAVQMLTYEYSKKLKSQETDF